ncbi:MAG: HD domain-containing protein [Mollicutes bacterium]|nr:HD domain-containing protein [Mollicutes bacterium]
MKEITIKDLLNKIREYNPEELEIINKAYEFVKKYHDGQFRISGEEYITHPINVAFILADLHADCDTVCAGLLHDVFEDTKCTKEDIVYYFNQDIALLVDGARKLSKVNFVCKEDQDVANTRKIITSITDDVRIIIIKLADRLHNMRTLEYKLEIKQKENALETIEIFAPLAYYISSEIGNTMVGVVVNGNYVPVTYTLNNKDIVRVITDKFTYRLRNNWLNKAHTTLAKKRIREFNK